MRDRPSVNPSRFILVPCYYCGNILISRITHHTKLCTYCHKRLTLRNANVVAKANTASEASRIAKKLKVKYLRT